MPAFLYRGLCFAVYNQTVALGLTLTSVKNVSETTKFLALY